MSPALSPPSGTFAQLIPIPPANTVLNSAIKGQTRSVFKHFGGMCCLKAECSALNINTGNSSHRWVYIVLLYEALWLFKHCICGLKEQKYASAVFHPDKVIWLTCNNSTVRGVIIAGGSILCAAGVLMLSWNTLGLTPLSDKITLSVISAYQLAWLYVTAQAVSTPLFQCAHISENMWFELTYLRKTMFAFSTLPFKLMWHNHIFSVFFSFYT